ncbi:MAG: hypothetical protein N3B18_13490 [Desulfobacterota bacterium]|nr:hypothetical protein [Thermodesulfobacteriota bacterium]
MKWLWLCAVPISALLCFGCGQSRNDDKGFAKRTNEEMSKRAVDYVNKPLSKARQVEGMAQQRQDAAPDISEVAEE